MQLKKKLKKKKKEIEEKDKKYYETAEKYEEDSYQNEIKNLKENGFMLLSDYIKEYGDFLTDHELSFATDSRDVDWIKINKK